MRTKNNDPITKAFGAFTALAATAQAATVQITLSGNKISSAGLGSSNLNADITGDGASDLTFTIPTVRMYSIFVGINYPAGGFVGASAIKTEIGSIFFVAARLNSPRVGIDYVPAARSPSQASYLNPICFTDARINGGAVTQAWLQVHAFNESLTSHTVALTRVIFDDASTGRPAFTSIPGIQTEFAAVPEPSGLILLALGAGGLLTRRKRQVA